MDACTAIVPSAATAHGGGIFGELEGGDQPYSANMKGVINSPFVADILD
jgi:hypothetical protein